MSFGKWLADKRKEAGLTQVQLAERAGVSFSYISSIEREEPVGKYGRPRKPTVEVVDKLALILKQNKDEVRVLAGFAPEHPLERPKPQTVSELLERLTELGIDQPMFKDGIENLPDDPDTLDEILRVISMTVEIELRKQHKNDPAPDRESMRR